MQAYTKHTTMQTNEGMALRSLVWWLYIICRKRYMHVKKNGMLIRSIFHKGAWLITMWIKHRWEEPEDIINDLMRHIFIILYCYGSFIPPTGIRSLQMILHAEIAPWTFGTQKGSHLHREFLSSGLKTVKNCWQNWIKEDGLLKKSLLPNFLFLPRWSCSFGSRTWIIDARCWSWLATPTDWSVHLKFPRFKFQTSE